MLNVMQKMQVNFVIKTLKEVSADTRKEMFAEILKEFCVLCGESNKGGHICKVLR